MLKNFIICFVTIASFYSCNRVEKKDNKTASITSDSLKNVEAQKDSLNPTKESDSVIYSNFNNTIIKEEFKDSLFTKFSNLETDDKFTFTIPVGNINHTKSTLKIFNNTGELIYEQSFTTRYLVNGYDLEHIKNDEELEKYVLGKAKEVLDLESFIDIPPKNKIEQDDIFNWPEDDFLNYGVFLECQKEKRRLFILSLGEEDTTYKGYSKNLKKVVDVIACC